MHVPFAVQQAGKAAVAASLSWLAVLPMDGVANSYPYYAPLGAVIAVSSTVAGSVRGSVQGLAAILIGATLALAARPLVTVEVLGLALVVAVGSWIAGWHRLGQMSGWVPISAMFVLIIGRTDPTGFVVAYLGLTSLGAAVGVGVNLVFPPPPLTGGHAVARMTETLIQQLHDLADGLRQPRPPTPEEWSERQHEVSPIGDEMRHMVAQMSEARRANWRAKRWRDLMDQQYGRVLAVEQLGFLVEDITTVLVDHETAHRDRVALGPRLRPPTADVLDRMADALTTVDGNDAHPDALREVDQSVQRLVDAIRGRRSELDEDDDMFTAGSVVIAVRRAIASLVPEELADELPSAG